MHQSRTIASATPMTPIWLSEARDDFEKMWSYTWGELQNADLFDEVYQVIGKGNKGKKKDNIILQERSPIKGEQ